LPKLLIPSNLAYSIGLTNQKRNRNKKRSLPKKTQLMTMLEMRELKMRHQIRFKVRSNVVKKLFKIVKSKL
jgi:hypothetical protein